MGYTVVARSADCGLADRLLAGLDLRTAAAVRRLHRRHQGPLRVIAQAHSTAVHVRREHGQHEGVRLIVHFVRVSVTRQYNVASVANATRCLSAALLSQDA